MQDESRTDWRLVQLEATTKKLDERVDGVESREAVRDVKVEVATSAMNRLAVVFGGMIITVVGAAALIITTGGAH